MKTRIHEWLDTKRLAPMFGIQVYAGGWKHAHRDGKPLIYRTRERAERERTKLRALASQTPGSGE